MFPWGAIIGLAGQAVSGIASAINNRKQQRAADAEAARQQAYYDARANENPLARSENQYLLGQYDRDAQRQVETARSISAITGATPEYSLGVQKAVAEGRANLMGKMSAGASARADYYNQLGEQAKHTKFQEDQERKAARNQTYANLAANAASAAGSIIDSYTASPAKAPKAPSAGKTPEQVNAQMGNLATVTDHAADKSARYAAASQLAGGGTTPEGQVLATTANAAQNAEKAATGTAVTDSAPQITATTPPDQSNFAAWSQYVEDMKKQPWLVSR